MHMYCIVTKEYPGQTMLQSEDQKSAMIKICTARSTQHRSWRVPNPASSLTCQYKTEYQHVPRGVNAHMQGYLPLTLLALSQSVQAMGAMDVEQILQRQKAYSDLAATLDAWRLAWKNACISLPHSSAMTPLRTCIFS